MGGLNIKERKILWIITARSGSKSIKDKNIKLLGGLPLLAYRIKSVLKIAEKEDVWISTDSRKYADIAGEYGAYVPFLRPERLATDTAKSVDVVLHAMNQAELSGEKYDAVGLLEPTSPFIKSSCYSEALEKLFMDEDAENIVAVRTVRPGTFYIQEDDQYLSVIARNIASLGVIRRQDENKEITPSGGFYISKWESFKKNQTFYTEKTLPYLVSDLEGLEIDEPIDWEWAEFLLERNIIDIKEIL